MPQYDLRHSKCGATWKAVYDKIPNEIECIECGKIVLTIYDPLVTVVRPEKSPPVELV